MMDFKKYFGKYRFFQKASDLASCMGVEVYVVGGYVRDLFIGRHLKDIDFLVVGSGIEFAKAFASALRVRNCSLYKNFGTASFTYRGIQMEFVGARKESYDRTSRNPIVEDGSFIDDISRRDFTINCLAVSLNKENFGSLVDRFSGLQDIKKGLIRTPMDPMITFNDDPLRIMRAFRFASQFGFSLEPVLAEVSGILRDRLKIISQERITDEFMKILASDQPSYGLKLMKEAGVLDVVFPEIARLSGVEQRKDYHHKDVFLHTCQVLDNIVPYTDNLYLRFAALVHDIAKPATKKFIDGIGWTFHGHEELGARMIKDIFRRFRLPMNKLPYVEKLVRLHLRPIALVDENVTDSAIRRFIVLSGDDLDDLIVLCRADITSGNPQKVFRYLENYEIVIKRVKEVEAKDALRSFQSPVSGLEIMELTGLKPSKQVGLIKTAIEDAILDGKIGNTHQEAYDYLLQIMGDFIS